MNTILITGRNGFTGEYVTRLFRKKGYRVAGIVQSDPREDDIVCDLTDKEAVRKALKKIQPNGIIHLAAISFVAHEDQSAFYKVNIFGTLNLLEVLSEENMSVDKVVIASSANVYGEPTVNTINEQTPTHPVNHYAMSKLSMEYMVQTWYEKFPIIITRPFNYAGPLQSEKFLVPKIVNHYKKKKKEIELGNIDVARDFSDVRDIAQAYFLLYKSDVRSDIFNICSGKMYALQEIIDFMNVHVGYEINIKINSLFVRENEIKKLGGDHAKIKNTVGYKPRYTLYDTLRDMYEE